MRRRSPTNAEAERGVCGNGSGPRPSSDPSVSVVAPNVCSRLQLKEGIRYSRHVFRSQEVGRAQGRTENPC